MLQIPQVGAFVRALLPVHLTAGDSLTFGVWLAIDPRNDRLRSLTEVWWDERRYPSLEIDGWLANNLPLWGLLGTPIHAAVVNPDETPYCVSSPVAEVTDVLTKEHDRETVLAAVDR